jgi:hypothetical protein
MDFSQLLNSFQSTGLSVGSSFAPPPPQQQQAAPADRFRVQLASLRDMGFDDELACIRALELHHGNVNRAIDYLFSNPGSAPVSSNSDFAAAEPATDSAPAEEEPAAPANSSSNDDSAPVEEEPKGSDDKKND